ncbi:Uncharacterised protein [Acinetobacter baumannii]|nr:Uncharacterised protein [Acinetobacter baumannii]
MGVSQLVGSGHIVFTHGLKNKPDSSQYQIISIESDDILRLKKELQRVTKKQDTLKKPRCTLQVNPT